MLNEDSKVTKGQLNRESLWIVSLVDGGIEPWVFAGLITAVLIFLFTWLCIGYLQTALQALDMGSLMLAGLLLLLIYRQINIIFRRVSFIKRMKVISQSEYFSPIKGLAKHWREIRLQLVKGGLSNIEADDQWQLIIRREKLRLEAAELWRNANITLNLTNSD